MCTPKRRHHRRIVILVAQALPDLKPQFAIRLKLRLIKKLNPHIQI
jgi:hypothetical protein